MIELAQVNIAPLEELPTIETTNDETERKPIDIHALRKMLNPDYVADEAITADSAETNPRTEGNGSPETVDLNAIRDRVAASLGKQARDSSAE